MFEPNDRDTSLSHPQAHAYVRSMLLSLVVATLGMAGCSDINDHDRESAEEVATASEPLWLYGAIGIVGTVNSDGTPIRLCRADIEGGLHPGFFEVENGRRVCTASYGQFWKSDDDAKALHVTWQAASNGAVPPGAERIAKMVTLSSYICRARLAATYHPGSLRPGSSGCSIGFGGSEQIVSNYEVLIHDLPVNVAAVGSTFPPEALAVGVDTDGKTLLYTCLARVNGRFELGKTRPDWNHCSIGYFGQDVSVTERWVMVPNWTYPNGQFWQAGNESDGEPLGFCRTRARYPKIGKLLTNGNCNVTYDTNYPPSCNCFDVLRHL